MSNNLPMVEKYCNMTRSLCLDPSFAKREVASRFACFIPLIGIQVAELAVSILKAPVEACAYLSILLGKKIFCANPAATWEKQWQPLKTLTKVGLLIICIFSTIIFGLFVPKFNHSVHENIGLLPPLETKSQEEEYTKQGPMVAALTGILKLSNENNSRLSQEQEKARAEIEQLRKDNASLAADLKAYEDAVGGDAPDAADADHGLPGNQPGLRSS